MKRLVILILFFSVRSISYPYNVQDFQKLFVELGYGYFKTSSNFDSESRRGSLLLNGDEAELVDNIVSLSGEFGIVTGWSIFTKVRYLNSTLTKLIDVEPSKSGAGIEELETGLKWSFRNVFPILTFETKIKLPFSTSLPNADDELVVSDRNLDIALLVHSGLTTRFFYFNFSPGLKFRFGGYSNAFVSDVAFGINFMNSFFELTVCYTHSFTNPQLYDSSPEQHDARGSGNSYSRLTGGPIGLNGGIRIGTGIYKSLMLTGAFERSIMGNKYSDFFKFSVNVSYIFDFYKKPEKLKVKEVPFDYRYN